MVCSRLRRGIAEGVAVVIAFSIIAISILYLILNFYSVLLIQQQVVATPSSYVNEKLVPFLIENVLNIKNVGSTVSRITHIVVVSSDGTKIVIDVSSNRLCNISSTILRPGDTSMVSCLGYIPIAIVTENGRVFSVNPEFYAIALEKTLGIPMTTIYGGVMLKSTSELLKFLENKSIMYRGAINTTTSLTPIINASGTNINVEAQLNASLVFIGVADPVTKKLNILAIGRGGSNSYIRVGDSIMSIAGVAPVRYRLKIENFTGSINLGLGIHTCYIDRSSFCNLVLNGRADRITLYNASRSISGVVGLDPYIFVGDINNNSNVEIIFVTQDFTIGNRTRVNDYIREGTSDLYYIDSTVDPIRIVFTGVPIDSNMYSSAILSMRMFFWDSSEDDISDNDNRVIMRVGLYDASTKSFIYSTQLSYYELNRYRNVKPFSISYITKDFTIHIPKTGNIYYLAVEFLDPYSREGTRNDTDLIIGLEYIGIALSSR
ncbi:MAG: hypothetical protein QXG84_02285 [Ignisphaera sp.]